MLVDLEVTGDIAVITLSRPDKRNALSVELVRDLKRALEAASGSRAIMITGEGSAFSAGADLSEDKVGGDFFAEFFSLTRALRAHPHTVVAYINGPAIGAGMMLAMACDLRVSAPEAFFNLPVADMAIGVDEWVVSTLASLLGGSRARSMLLAGTTLDAATSAACGFSTPGSRDDALALTHTAAVKAPLTVRNIKVEFAPELFTAEERNAALRAPYESNDVDEALRARREKRTPRFTGE